VKHLLDMPPGSAEEATLTDVGRQIAAAPWFVLSARRADNLLREKLFERVFAVRMRGFTRTYRNAELDMHFSLREDLTPLPDFLQSLRERGLHGMAVDLERGLV
jgi:hypothetical protein